MNRSPFTRCIFFIVFPRSSLFFSTFEICMKILKNKKMLPLPNKIKNKIKKYSSDRRIKLCQETSRLDKGKANTAAEKFQGSPDLRNFLIL